MSKKEALYAGLIAFMAVIFIVGKNASLQQPDISNDTEDCI